MFKSALEILNTLNENGYFAYIIGGYVRDKLMNIENNDIDIITDATPTQICSIFNSDVDNNYGSIKLRYNNYIFDITTFRKESNYNNRKPCIEYIDSLEEDLKRRDFTINTICMDKDENYIDLLNGINDLNNKLVKSVGNPVDKIKEDPLRILRAIRFASIYNLTIDKELKDAIILNTILINKLSFDRIKQELNLIFNSSNVIYAFDIFKEFNLLEILKIKPINNIIPTCNYLSIWAQLKYGNDYNFSKEDKKNIEEIKSIVNKGDIDNYILYKYNLDNIKEAKKILGIEIDVDKKYNDLPIHSRKDINITYEKIKNALNITNINEIYVDLEKQILYNNVKNEERNIITYLVDKYKRR